MLSTRTRLSHVRRAAIRSGCQLELAMRRRQASNPVFPTDEPFGRIAGSAIDRVAFLGDWNVAGLGVATYQLALPGTFARAWTAQTGRGVDWAIVPVSGFRLSAVPQAVAAAPLSVANADLAVLQLGVTETMMFVSAEQWRGELTAAIEVLLASMASNGCLVVAAIPPLDRLGRLTGPSARAVGRECRMLDSVSRRVVREYRRCHFAEFPEGLAEQVWIPGAKDFNYRRSYAVWGPSLAGVAARSREGTFDSTR